jgi:hypothetical protein
LTGGRYLALEVVAVPFRAVVEALLLAGVEPRVTRVAGHRRHPRFRLLSSFLPVRRARRRERLSWLAVSPLSNRVAAASSRWRRGGEEGEEVWRRGSAMGEK